MDDTDDHELKSVVDRSEAELKTLKEELESEEDKYKKWKTENIRRKHNYIPFAFNLLKVLAQKGKLQELVKKGNEATTARAARQKAEKEKEKADKSKDSKSKDTGTAVKK